MSDMNDISCTIYWDKLNENAKVPTKRREDAGLDLYH